MKRFEYSVVQFPMGKGLSDELNRLGAKGWRLVTLKGSFEAYKWTTIFEREIEESEPNESQTCGCGLWQARSGE